jgi:hypothetical protein
MPRIKSIICHYNGEECRAEVGWHMKGKAQGPLVTGIAHEGGKQYRLTTTTLVEGSPFGKVLFVTAEDNNVGY